MTPTELKDIIARHKTEAKLFDAIKSNSDGLVWQSHIDRGALLEYIDQTSTLPKAAAVGCMAAAGKVIGSVSMWLVVIWIFRSDLIQMATWFVSHVRVSP